MIFMSTVSYVRCAANLESTRVSATILAFCWPQASKFYLSMTDTTEACIIIIAGLHCGTRIGSSLVLKFLNGIALAEAGVPI